MHYMYGVKVGITFSTFDLFHAGHIAMLEECKRQCDFLIVGLQTDPTIDRPDTKNKPAQSIYERWVQLDACKFVDKIIPYSTEADLIDILLSQKIDVRFLGEEYKDKEFTGKYECFRKKIKLVFNSRDHRFSTTELRKRAAIK
jgi:glycerol-3-phosphate cytidylyltransferase